MRAKRPSSLAEREIVLSAHRRQEILGQGPGMQDSWNAAE